MVVVAVTALMGGAPTQVRPVWPRPSQAQALIHGKWHSGDVPSPPSRDLPERLGSQHCIVVHTLSFPVSIRVEPEPESSDPAWWQFGVVELDGARSSPARSPSCSRKQELGPASKLLSCLLVCL